MRTVHIQVEAEGFPGSYQGRVDLVTPQRTYVITRTEEMYTTSNEAKAAAEAVLVRGLHAAICPKHD